MLTIVLLVGLAGRFRRWWLIAGAGLRRDRGVVRPRSPAGSRGAGTHPLRDPGSPPTCTRLERIEGVAGTPVRVQNVSSWTSQANAFTVGFGPSTHVVLWDTLLDGRFSRGEEDVVIAHELGHVAQPPHRQGDRLERARRAADALAARRSRCGGAAGSADPRTSRTRSSCSPCSALLTRRSRTPSRAATRRRPTGARLNATQDPASATKLFESFETTSLEQPNPPAGTTSGSRTTRR